MCMQKSINIYNVSVLYSEWIILDRRSNITVFVQYYTLQTKGVDCGVGGGWELSKLRSFVQGLLNTKYAAQYICRSEFGS